MDTNCNKFLSENTYSLISIGYNKAMTPYDTYGVTILKGAESIYKDSEDPQRDILFNSLEYAQALYHSLNILLKELAVRAEPVQDTFIDIYINDLFLYACLKDRPLNELGLDPRSAIRYGYIGGVPYMNGYDVEIMRLLCVSPYKFNIYYIDIREIKYQPSYMQRYEDDIYQHCINSQIKTFFKYNGIHIDYNTMQTLYEMYKSLYRDIKILCERINLRPYNENVSYDISNRFYMYMITERDMLLPIQYTELNGYNGLSINMPYSYSLDTAIDYLVDKQTSGFLDGRQLCIDEVTEIEKPMTSNTQDSFNGSLEALIYGTIFRWNF